MSTGALVLPPFVASAIVEHAKRRRNAAGYLVGNRSGNQITVTDYIPCTHESTMEVRSRTYIDDLNDRVATKKYYTPSIMLVGWYAAGAPEEGKARAFDVWCQAPGASFSRIRSNNQAVMLLCRMPTENDVTISWDACITRNYNEGDTFQCERTQSLAVSIEAETPSMNVVLAEMVSKSFHNGGSLHPWSSVTNLDRVALNAEKEAQQRRENSGETRPLEVALAGAQNKLHEAIANARGILESGNKSNKEQIAQCASVLENYEAIVEKKNQQVSRDDFITENYKDALMVKYMVALLRRHVTEIERHARYEAREKPAHGHGQGHTGGQRGRRGNFKVDRVRTEGMF